MPSSPPPESALQATLQRAVQHHQNNEISTAKSLYLSLLATHPNHPDVNHLLGIIANQEGHYQASVGYIEHAINQNPNVAAYYNNLANSLLELGYAHQAALHYQQALALEPSFYLACYGLGNAQRLLGHYDHAEQCYQTVLQHKPQFAPALNNYSLILIARQDMDGAKALLQQLLQLAPHHIEANINYLLCDFITKHYAKLIIRAKLQLTQPLSSPHRLHTLVFQANAEQALCQWTACQQTCQHIEVQIGAKDTSWSHAMLDPSMTHGLPLPAATQHKIVASYQARLVKQYPSFKHPPLPPQPTRLHIGYLSCDFNTHPVGLLIRDLFNYHDRQAFKITLFHLGPQDTLTAQICAGADRFINLTDMPFQQAAQQIHAQKIDLLIDLTGYARRSAVPILAHRPAPIQAHWLGYADTLGQFMDYHITTETLIPPAQTHRYFEQMAYLPQVPVATTPFELTPNLPPRSHFDLPDCFVFCSFIQHERICEQSWTAWMQILQQCPNSILWLYAGPQATMHTLQQAAETHNVSADRIKFYSGLSLTKQWPHRFADVWLDSLSVSSATGIMTCQQLGLPSLVIDGDRPINRYAKALLDTATNRPLIANSVAAYMDTAVYWYHDPDALATLRQSIQKAFSTNPLFQAATFIKALETLCQQLYRYASTDQRTPVLAADPAEPH